MRVEYFLNGRSVNPVNRNEIFIEVNHDDSSLVEQPRPHVGIGNLFFVREDVQRVMDELGSNPGITEGVPFDIRLTNRTMSKTINMYLDLMDSLKVSREGVTPSVKMVQSLDQLDDRVDSFTFESLYNETGVQPFIIDGITYPNYQKFLDDRCVYIPYVISTVPNGQQAFLALFSIVYVATQLYQTLKTIVQWLTPAAGAGITVGVLQVAAEIAYALILVLTLIALINQLIDCLIQPLKYHGAMLISDLLKVASAKLGFDFQSSVWNQFPFNQLVYIPEKFSPVDYPTSVFNLLGFNVNGFGGRGFTQPINAPTSSHNSTTGGFQKGYLNGTGGDVFRLAKRLMNGKIIMPTSTNTLQIERRDYYPSGTPYQLPPLRSDWNGFNTDELSANIILRFQSDLNERNSVDYKMSNGQPFYIGTIMQATHGQNVTVNKNLVNLKGIREIDIPCSRGVMKDRLTIIEDIVKHMKIVWDGITALQNIGTAGINAAITYFNYTGRFVINVIIAIFNEMVSILRTIANVLNDVIDAVNTLPIVNIGHISFLRNFHLDELQPIQPLVINVLTDYNESGRLNALLVEDDFINTPKVVMIDTSRSEFTTRRIGYLHAQNHQIVNASYLWNNFYFIDSFAEVVSGVHNRFTKIQPSLNTDSETNPVILNLDDFDKLTYNPKFLDHHSEEVFADSVQWFIEQGGKANIQYRKKGWLKNPQSENALLRSQEIAINLNIKTSTPNGN